MAKPKKFKIAVPKIKIVNRCVICGVVIPPGEIICSTCKRMGKKIR